MSSETPVSIAPAGADTRLADLDRLLSVIAPLVEADGGTLELVDADTGTGVVTVRLAGACGSCAIAGNTLDEGVKRILTERLDWVTDVIGHVEASEDEGHGRWQPR